MKQLVWLVVWKFEVGFVVVEVVEVVTVEVVWVVIAVACASVADDVCCIAHHH